MLTRIDLEKVQFESKVPKGITGERKVGNNRTFKSNSQKLRRKNLKRQLE
jgi:hypothetical protein